MGTVKRTLLLGLLERVERVVDTDGLNPFHVNALRAAHSDFLGQHPSLFPTGPDTSYEDGRDRRERETAQKAEEHDRSMRNLGS
jgi:hypothetical protein